MGPASQHHTAARPVKLNHLIMFGKKGILPLLLIICSLILFVINLIELKKGAVSENGPAYGMLSNVLLIIGMVFVLIGNRKSP
jgi:membrane protease YdiL (CAAX protease family)